VDTTPVVPGHMGFEPVAPEQEDFGRPALGHKDSALVALRHRDFGPATLGQKDSKPVSL